MTVDRIIDEQGWLDPVASGLQRVVKSGYSALGGAGQPLQNLLHGTWLGHPLHPVLTDVTTSAWAGAGLLDTLELAGRKEMAPAADVAITAGLISALGTALAGVTDWYVLRGKGSRRTGALHALLNIGAIACYASSKSLRKRGQRPAGHFMAFAGLGLLGAASYLGGHLVFALGIGPNRAIDKGKGPKKFVDVYAGGELRDDEPVGLEVEGEPVLLVRHAGRIYAMSDVCSHLGCKLSEGHLEGDSVRCECHGSRYALEDGRALDGPSTYTQPLFETRLRNGQIAVRAARN